MNKRIIILISSLIAVLAATIIGLSIWKILIVETADIDSVQSFEVINYNDYIDLTNNNSSYVTTGSNKNVLKYYDTGFLDISSTNIQEDAVIRCYFSLVPKNLKITNNTFNINFILEEVDDLNLLIGTTISSRVVQQTSVSGFSVINTGNTNSITYNNISSNYSVRLYMYVEYIISGIDFDDFIDNVNDVIFKLKVNVENSHKVNWEILYEEELLPQKDNLTYLANNLDGKEKAYTNNPVDVYTNSSSNPWDFLFVSEALTINTIKSKYNITYLNDLTNTYSSTLPTNAGTYHFRIKYNDSTSEYRDFNFTIVGTKIYAVVLDENDEYEIENYPVFELAFNELLTYTWDSDFETKIKEKLTFRTESGTPALTTNSEYSIVKLSDSSFTYEKSGNSYIAKVPSEFSNKSNNVEQYKNVAGSTYLVSIVLNNGGYTLQNKIILKYKTAYANNNYYTIEDAISKNQSIYISVNLDSYITTSFTASSICQKLYDSSAYTLNESLILPIVQNELPSVTINSKKYYGIDSLSTCNLPGTVDNTNTTTSCLFVPENITLTVNGKIYVCAQLSRRSGGNLNASPSAVNHAVLFNAGTINIMSGGNLYSYGYTKGTYKEMELNNNKVINHSVINSYFGSQIYEIMAFHDWMGGTSASKYLNSGAFIFSTWTLCNISAYIKIYRGAKMNAISDVDADNTHHYVDAGIVGTNTDSNCLFKPDVNATQYDYFAIHGTYNGDSNINHDPNAKITKSNQLKMQKGVIELNGKYVDSNFSVTIYITMSASSFNSLTISNLDIIITNNSVISLSTFSITFLLGTKLEVQDGASVILNNSKFLAFDTLNGNQSTLCTYITNNSLCKNLQSAEFINNGSIIINSGSIGGTITTNSQNALVVNNNKISKIITRGDIPGTLEFAHKAQSTNNYSLKGNLLDDENIIEDYLPSPNKSLESAKIRDEFYWKEIKNTYNYIVNFYDESKTLIYSYNFNLLDSSTQFSNSFFTPTKLYYEFKYWTTDLDEDNPKDADGDQIYPVDGNNAVSLIVYPYFVPITYNVSYNPIFGTSLLSLNDANISGTDSLITEFRFDGNNFYYGEDFATSSTSLPLNVLEYTYNDSSCTFEGWDIYIEVLDNSKTVNTSLSKSAFVQLVDTASGYGINLADYAIPLVCRFYNYPTLTITYNVDGYDNPSNNNGIGNFVFTTPNINNYSIYTITESTYFVGWENDTLGIDLDINEDVSVTIDITSSGYQYSINGIPINISNTPTLELTAKFVNKPHTLTLDYIYPGVTVGNETIIGSTKDYYYMDGQIYEVTQEPTYEDYKFSGWYENYEDGNWSNEFNTSSSITSSKTIYAKWVSPVVITFNNNGGTGTMSPQNIAPGVPTNLNKNEFERTGYTFSGWNTESNDSGTPYSNQASVTSEVDITLYAQWTPNNYKITITTSNSSTEVTVNGTTVNNGGSVPYNSVVKVVLSYSQSNSKTFSIKQGSNNVTYYSNEACTSSTTSTSAGTYYFKMPTGDVTINSSSSSGGGSCLLPNTLVTMADGTYKEIQYLTSGDLVRVFNHETGMIDVAPVTFNEYEDIQWFNVIHLIFDDGSDIGVISEHGFFDLDTMKYEYIDESNYQDYIGHRFYKEDGLQVTLVGSYIMEEYTMCYELPSYYHLNFFTEGILSMPGGIEGLFNIFDYADNLQYDQEKMIEDINTYGLFTIEEFEPYGVTEEMFYAYAGQYLKVALGKGILTEEYLMYLVERYGKYTE